jgi:hypothetical protein
MSTRPHDPALDVLLADYVPPPMPDDLTARIAEAAVAMPQAAARAASCPWRDRRGAWLRRPLLIGGAALGLAFSGAVAATYAGVELPPKIQSALAELPFVKAKVAPAPEKAASQAQASAARVEPAAATPSQYVQDVQGPQRSIRVFWRELSPYERRRLRNAPPGRRLIVARQIVQSRRSAGLPTPGAEQIERAFERRRAIRQQRRAMPEGRIEAPARRPADALVTDRLAPDGVSGRGERADRLERREALRAERRERRRALREERLRRWQARQERLRLEPPGVMPLSNSGAEMFPEEGEGRGPGLLGRRPIVTGD